MGEKHRFNIVQYFIGQVVLVKKGEIKQPKDM